MLDIDILGAPPLDYEGWRDALRTQWGQYNPEVHQARDFSGRARSRSLCGLEAMDLSCNAHRVERTPRDIQLDGVDHYYAVFQVAGSSAMIQNGRAVQLTVGDAALVDSARPVTYVSEASYGQWFSLQLPRRTLVSHLGFDPQGGTSQRSGTTAAQVLFGLVRDASINHTPAFSRAESFMHLAMYDLIGALFAPSDPWPASSYREKTPLSRKRAAVLDPISPVPPIMTIFITDLPSLRPSRGHMTRSHRKMTGETKSFHRAEGIAL